MVKSRQLVVVISTVIFLLYLLPNKFQSIQCDTVECSFVLANISRNIYFEINITDVDESGNGTVMTQVTAPHYSGSTYPASGYSVQNGNLIYIVAFYLIQEVNGRIDLDIQLDTLSNKGYVIAVVHELDMRTEWHYIGDLSGGCVPLNEKMNEEEQKPIEVMSKLDWSRRMKIMGLFKKGN